jgi:hypothetical protein
MITIRKELDSRLRGNERRIANVSPTVRPGEGGDPVAGSAGLRDLALDSCLGDERALMLT